MSIGSCQLGCRSLALTADLQRDPTTCHRHLFRWMYFSALGFVADRETRGQVVLGMFGIDEEFEHFRVDKFSQSLMK